MSCRAEPQARRILEVLGVEWDDAVLSFHEKAKARSLSTPSFEAVTEKVHTRAVGRWRNYAERYEPVMEHLAPYIEAFGYSDV